MNTALGELSALLPGQVTRPGEPEWDQMRYGFNLAVDQQPVAVVTAVDEEDVVATVRWANRYGATVSAQPVGHGATRATDGVVVLRTRGLREIVVDPERRVARVGAGAKWGEVLAATAPYGLTGLAGSSPDPDGRRLLAQRRAQLVRPRLWPGGAQHPRRSTSSTRRASVAGSPRRATRTCSGRCAAGAATSASRSRSRSRCTPRRTSTAVA